MQNDLLSYLLLVLQKSSSRNHQFFFPWMLVLIPLSPFPAGGSFFEIFSNFYWFFIMTPWKDCMLANSFFLNGFNFTCSSFAPQRKRPAVRDCPACASGGSPALSAVLLVDWQILSSPYAYGENSCWP